MASRRMISSDMYEDEFYIGLDLFGRNLWVGLIVKCADDQGRMQDNSILIKSQIFPADDIDPQLVENTLAIFANDKRIIRYTAGGKKLIQIPTWWKHQTPQWASKSRYPAPEGWVDREKYHAPGNKIENHNWNHPGGFEVSNSLSNSLSNHPPSGLNDGDGDGDGKGESESRGDTSLSEFAPPEIAIVHEVTGLLPDISNEPRIINNIQTCRKRLHNPPRDLLLAELTTVYKQWCETKTRDGRLYNPSNWDWTERAATGYTPAPPTTSHVRMLKGADGTLVEDR